MNTHDMDVALSDPGFFIDHDPHPLWKELRERDPIHWTEGLGKPSSAARALFGGAANIERVDCLVRRIAVQKGLQSSTLDEIVTLVDQRLTKNLAAR